MPRNDYFSAYLDMYGVNRAPQSEAEQRVDQAAVEKQAEIDQLTSPDGAFQAMAGRQSEVGYESASEIERDFRSLSPQQLENKYGIDAARRMVQARSAANDRYNANVGESRTGGQIFGDMALSAIDGGISGLGGIASWGLGEANPELGVQSAQMFGDISESLRSGQSDYLGREQDNLDAARTQARRDRNLGRDPENESWGDTVLKIAGEFGDTLALSASSGANVSDIIAQAAGSLASGSVVGAGIRKVAAPVGSAIANAAGNVSARAGSAASRAGEVAPMAVAIGLQEGGGAYNQAVQEALSILDESQPNLSQEERAALANEAGTIAARTQAPIGAVTGLVVARFEANPLRGGRVGSFAGNAGREGAEETFQSGAGAAAVNLGLQENVDPNRSLTEGVGADAAEGLIGGIGSAVGFQGPGAAVGAIVDGVTASGRLTMRGVRAAADSETARAAGNATRRALTPLYDRIVQRADDIRNSYKEGDPVGDEETQTTMQRGMQSFNDFRQRMADVISPEEAGVSPEEEIQINDLARASSFNPESDLDEATPGFIREGLSESRDRFEAMTTLARMVQEADEGSADQAAAARELARMYNQFSDLVSNDSSDVIEENSPARGVYESLIDGLAKLRDNETIRNAVNTAYDKLSKFKISPIEESELNTPEGQRKVQDTISIAENVPEKANLENNQRVLEHASKGRIQLSETQRAALMASSALLQAERDIQESREKLGLKTKTDFVSEEVLTRPETGSKDPLPSLSSHAKRILGAYRAGDTDAAKAYLEDLMAFSQHMQNKVAALNEAYASGANSSNNTVTYDALNARREWVEAPKGVYVSPTNRGSIVNTQTIAKEADIVSAVANQMADIFPELEVAQQEYVELNPELQGNVDEVVARQEAKPKKEKKASSQTEPTEQPAQEEVQDLRQAKIFASTTKQLQDILERRPEGINQDTLDMIEVELQNRALEEALAEPAQEQTPAPEANPVVEPESDQQVATESQTQPEETPTEAPVESAIPEPTFPTDDLDVQLQENTDTLKEISDYLGIGQESNTASQAVAPLEETIKTVYPNLENRSRFYKAFKLPKEAISRLTSIGSPFDFVRGVLTDPGYFSTMLPSDEMAKRMSPQVIAAYEDLLDNSQALLARLNNRLANYGKKPVSQKDSTPRLQAWLEGKPYHRYDTGRVLNVAEIQNGRLVYNEELAQSAVLAGVQWLMVANRYQSERDESNIASLLGVTENDLNRLVPNHEALLTEFQQGLTTVEAVRSLADMIRAYWGVTPNKNAYEGEIQGIPEAMAKEVLSALDGMGMIEISTPVQNIVGEEAIKANDLKIPNLIKVQKVDEENPLHDLPDAIDLVVRTKPQRLSHVGAEPKAVATTQLNNAKAELTTEQRAAIRARQAVKYTLNKTMLGFYQALNNLGVQELFGGGIIDEDLVNNQHLETLKGRNTTFLSALRSVREMVQEVEADAQSKGIDPEEVPVHFEYTFNKMNRLQMLGVNNPQSSKLMREVLLSTWSTVDLSSLNSKAFTMFGLTLAQHLGEKIELMNPEDAAGAALKLLGSKYARSVAGLQAWLQNGDGALPENLVGTLKEEAGGTMEPGELHALMDYARFLNATPEERKSFRTALYLEADGVTNGPINAMALFTPGAFTADWLSNIARGGLFFGSEKAMFQREDSADLYQKTTNTMENFLGDFLQKLSGNEQAIENTLHMFTLLDMFFGKDVTFEDGEVTFGRGFSKNPLTVTVYGSAAKGIADKITGNLAREIYARLSDVMAAQAEDPSLSVAEALFPNHADPEAQLERFGQAYDALINSEVGLGRKGPYVRKLDRINWEMNPKTFELTGNAFERLRTNMLKMIVNPMRDAIADTMGNELMLTMDNIQQATQLQSIALQYAFRREIDRMVAKKQANDPEYRKSDFLTRKELDQAFKNISHLQPIINTGKQNFYIANSERADTSGIEFSRSLSGKMKTPGFVDGPYNAGVKGKPSLVIGSGDGMMMQGYAASREGPGRTLDVFDGLNMPLDMIDEYSQRINGAVFQSWQNNPLQGVSDTFSIFLDNWSIDGLSKEEAADIKRALFGDADAQVSKAEVRRRIDELQSELADAAVSIKARQNVMARVSLSVDQMAGAGRPFHNKGDIDLSGRSQGEIVEILNELYVEELSKLQETEEATVPKEVAEVSTVDEATGVHIVRPNMFKQLGESLKAGGWKLNVLSDILGSLERSETRVVSGSVDQLRAFMVAEGLPAVRLERRDARVNGLTLPDSNLVILVNPTAETYVHELIHAATFNKVAAYYENGSLPAADKNVINRLEKLQEQFLELDVSNESPETQKAFSDARDAILGHLSVGNQAQALNEFMAWGLSNQNIAEKLSKTKAHPLARLARDVINMIKKLVFGTKANVAVVDDMLTNLRFNTAVLAEAEIDHRSEFQDTILYHSERYGKSDRLVEINQTLSRKLIRHLRKTLAVKGYAQHVADKRVDNQLKDISRQAKEIVDAASVTFGMNMQEHTTFRTLVQVMMTSVQLDPNAMTQAGELFRHVTQKLTVEDFMQDPALNDPADRQQARRKIDFVLRQPMQEMDGQDRTTMIPAFVALATVNEEFRSALRRMELPQGKRNSNGTLDAWLENIGNGAMDRLAKMLSGQGQNARNVETAIDNLIDQVVETAAERKSFMGMAMSSVGGALDATNDAVANFIEASSEKVSEKAKSIRDNTKSKAVKVGAQATNVAAGLVNRRIANNNAEEFMAEVNRSEIPTFGRDLIGDIIGRTENNAPVYDLIKRVRSWVSQKRQQYREHLPKTIAEQFSRKLEESEWADLFHGLGKTDLAQLRQNYTMDEIVAMLREPSRVVGEIERKEAELRQLQQKAYPVIERKMKQLAHYMNTGEPDHGLLRNAAAISELLGERKPKGYRAVPGQDQVIDTLTTLYAVQGLPQARKEKLAELASEESKGIGFIVDYMRALHKNDAAIASQGMGRFNSYKGHMPQDQTSDVTLVVASDTEYKDLRAKNFVRVADYEGSSLDGNRRNMGYYMAPVSARANYRQGIMQTAQQTAGGVDLSSGYTRGRSTVGVISDRVEVSRIHSRRFNEKGKEPLLPVYDWNGDVVAYERSADPVQLAALELEEHMAVALGKWAGRQEEEREGRLVNQLLIQNMHDMWMQDTQGVEGSVRQKEYVDLFDPKIRKKDPVVKDMIDSLPSHVVNDIVSVFGDKFYVRKDMLNDAMGYRDASVRNLWDEQSRISPAVLKVAQDVAIAAMGKNAYKMAVNGEKFVKNLITDLRVLIVVKSVIVPAANLTWNVFQLASRGVPLGSIAKGMPGKLSEVNTYVQNRDRQIAAEAELRAAGSNAAKKQRLETEINTIEDINRRLSIWPLIEAGELTSISDGMLSEDDLKLRDGRLHEYFEKAADKLPGPAKTAARYGLIARDTALFKGLQRSIEYGDFLAKAVLYEDLVGRQGKSSEEALVAISDEFVNYDRLPGRSRGYAEEIGLLWFWNFKLRSMKTAVSIMRNNPVHAMLAMNFPFPDLFGPVGSPLTDNAFSVMLDGRADYSIGPGMGLRAPYLNPLAQIMT